MEFQVNDSVLYGAEGVCRITDICEQDFMGERAMYYVLKPVYGATSTVFVPVNNERLKAKMRRILSAEEIYRCFPLSWSRFKSVRGSDKRKIIPLDRPLSL